ncbi:MFS transporter [Serinicoccus marinus]|uniref:MFS transporter n=1 Tax=Serinicoccus marinus TaxID=247333 RepID=UPI0003B5908E|nr:MFS transporter [Serinicoccus marinus]
MTTTATTADRTFHHLLVNTALAGLTTSYLWFGLTFWAYLQTRSDLATGIIGGAYMLLVAFSSVFFGTLVDHHRQLPVMRVSSTLSLVAFTVAGLLYLVVPQQDTTDLTQPWFWTLSVIIIAGAVVEHPGRRRASAPLLVQVAVDQRDDRGAFAGGGGDPLHAAGPDVPGGEDPGHAGCLRRRWQVLEPLLLRHLSPGEHEAALVEGQLRRQPVAVRLGADEQEEPVDLDPLAVLVVLVLELQPLQPVIAPPSTTCARP